MGFDAEHRNLVNPDGGRLKKASSFSADLSSAVCPLSSVVNRPVYLDYNATTPLDPAALEAMTPFLREEFGNPSSRHDYGRRAREAVEKARAQTARAVGAKPEEVVFTASGTESNNTVIKGVAVMATRGVIAVGATEHPCVLCAARATARGGFVHAPIAVDSDGRIDRDDLRDILSGGDCALVSVMLANNETGVLQQIPELVEMAHSAGALFHTDAAQALGKIPLDFRALGADAMTISGHKAYGPKGAAALIARRGMDWAPLLDGGGHEEGRRSGTENTPAIVGFGVAAQIAAQRAAEDAPKLAALRDRAEDELKSAGAVIFGGEVERLPNTCCFGFPGIDGESLVVMMDQSGFALASGAACSSMKDEPSHVLLSMGFESDVARTAVRFSAGRDTTMEDVEKFTATAAQIAERLRGMSAVMAS